MASFQNLEGFSFINNPEAEAHRSYAHTALNYKTEREHVRKKLLNLKKTTKCYISVLLLIYD